MGIPVVAIVGRPNVGKSSLFNVLARRRVAIVEPTPGVTRDRVSTRVGIDGLTVELTDTGGLGMDEAAPFAGEVTRQAKTAIGTADLILFVVDIREGVTPLDRDVADLLRRAPDRNVLVVANKADLMQDEPLAAEFHRFGLGAPLCVSAAQQRGLGELREAIRARLKDRAPGAGREAGGEPFRFAVIGRRNVGKSTFVNNLAAEERVIVSEIPGTTRDAVDVRFEREGRTYVAIDTAGLRKKGKLDDAIEFFSQVRTRDAIMRADAVLFLFDVTQTVSSVDQAIARILDEAGKPCIVYLNKWDLAGKREPAEFHGYFRKELPGLEHAPIVVGSAREGTQVWDAVDLAVEVHAQGGRRITTHDLNEFVERLKVRNSPPASGGKLPKMFYMTQTAIHPPTFLLFVNEPKWFRADYLRSILQLLRSAFDLPECPIRLHLRGRAKVFLPEKKEKRAGPSPQGRSGAVPRGGPRRRVAGRRPERRPRGGKSR